MKKLHTISIAIVLGLQILAWTSKAQNVHFVLDKAIELKCPSQHFGGISGIEYLADKGVTLMVSDKDEHRGPSHAFIMYREDSIRELITDFPGIGNYNDIQLKEIESFRYNKKQRKFYFSYESDHTGVGSIEAGNKEKIVFTEDLPSSNRGIEGIAFTSNNDLWAAEESGKGTLCDKDLYTTFYKFSPGKDGYNGQHATQFTYPLNRCSCSGGKSFNGRIGNGVSEILAFDANKLLVLERCWDGGSNGSNVMLYLATINEKNKTLTKQLLVDVNAILNGKKVDNLEGMTWGKPIKGQRTLYLVSDDNFNSKQVTQFIILREVQ